MADNPQSTRTPGCAGKSDSCDSKPITRKGNISKADAAEKIPSHDEGSSSSHLPALALPTVSVHEITLVKRHLIAYCVGREDDVYRQGLLAQDLDVRRYSKSMHCDVEVMMMRAKFGVPDDVAGEEILVTEYPLLESAIHAALMSKFEHVRTVDDLEKFPNISREEFFYVLGFLDVDLDDGRFADRGKDLDLHHFAQFDVLLAEYTSVKCGLPFGRIERWQSYHSGWIEVYRQLFLPYFLVFADLNEALAWCPPLSILRPWRTGLTFLDSPSVLGWLDDHLIFVKKPSTKLWMWFKDSVQGMCMHLVRGYLD